LRKLTFKKTKFYHVELDSAYDTTGVARGDLVAKLNSWHDDRYIDLKTGGVINIYRVMDTHNWPPSKAEAQQVIDKMYEEMQLREKQDLNRFKQVDDLITGTETPSQAYIRTA
jgi:hypothetical protein